MTELEEDTFMMRNLISSTIATRTYIAVDHQFEPWFAVYDLIWLKGENEVLVAKLRSFRESDFYVFGVINQVFVPLPYPSQFKKFANLEELVNNKYQGVVH